MYNSFSLFCFALRTKPCILFQYTRYYFLDSKDKLIANYLYLNPSKCVFPTRCFNQEQKKAYLVVDLCIIFVYLYYMKHFLLITYSLYFTCLMVVPCNHTLLYTKVMENVVGINMHAKCNHATELNNENHQHHDKHSKHHHSCTPFCACGITHFVLNIPQFQHITALPATSSRKNEMLQTAIWAIPADNYKKLIAQDIWHPPQIV